MEILFLDTEDWEQEYLKERLSGNSLVFEKSTNFSHKQAEIICLTLGTTADEKFISNFPALKYVTTRTTGFDHIDVKYCQSKQILASNVPAYGEHTVAEFTFALILALSRKIYPAVKRVREFGDFNFDGLIGFDLQGKTIGVIGTGRIGSKVISIAKGFGMNVVAYDAHQNLDLAKNLGFEYLPLEEVLKQSDIITLHAPYNPSTHYLINKQNIILCKKGSMLINTARGGLVETEALITALEQGILAGAGLDVLEEEGFVKDEMHLLYHGHPNLDQLKTVFADHKLMQMDNVLVTPHNAFNTKEALIRILDVSIANIQAFISGKPINILTK